MALLEKHLFVKESTIPGSGLGLFTKIFIPKGTRIVEYKGRITTWKEVAHDSENGYLYTINTKHVIDAGRTKSALARYANDAKGISRVKGISNNCDYINYGLKAYIESVKDIPAGAEILVAYGKEYWDVRRANIKLDQRNKQKLAQRKKQKVK
jgi:SET domain-containing protein